MRKWFATVVGVGVSEPDWQLPQDIYLELSDDAYAGVPCWTGGAQLWARVTVPIAYYSHYRTRVAPHLPGAAVSLKAIVRVADARARYADFRTGRNCRPTNERLVCDTGLSKSTVQRASKALRLLGVATEVFRGRQRTRTERMASWRVGDRGRGWASVWALHVPSYPQLTPHPVGSLLSSYLLFSKKKVTTGQARKPSASTKRGASRPPGPKKSRSRHAVVDPGGYALARQWLRAPQTPRWARRYTPRVWSRSLTAVAAHGWTAEDLNQLLRDWERTGGHWMPAEPYKPIGLVCTAIGWHERNNSLDDRPAALELAMEQERLRRHEEERRQFRAEMEAARIARREAQGRLGKPAHRAAQQVAAEIAARAARKRAAGEEAERQARAELVARVRGQR
ncbi:hypothetical protein [Mycolicibacterium sp. J2]|uniref:hypothetical protein n=1 Tax=Mycolicibacterium sp. J2 TaxID=2993511 RepID=UPI00224B3BF4|nr:hypothetical protein [Mycolicibacterium sp. J2]MCX2715862.1 hypothetical protein [Mycolicibacterium sp. J2]